MCSRWNTRIVDSAWVTVWCVVQSEFRHWTTCLSNKTHNVSNVALCFSKKRKRNKEIRKCKTWDAAEICHTVLCYVFVKDLKLANESDLYKTMFSLYWCWMYSLIFRTEYHVQCPCVFSCEHIAAHAPCSGMYTHISPNQLQQVVYPPCGRDSSAKRVSPHLKNHIYINAISGSNTVTFPTAGINPNDLTQ